MTYPAEDVATLVDDMRAFVTDCERALVLLGRPSVSDLASILVVMHEIRAELRTLYGNVASTLVSELDAHGLTCALVPHVGRVYRTDDGVRLPPTAFEPDEGPL